MQLKVRENRSFYMGFWLKAKNNPYWRKLNSKVELGEFTVEDGSRVFVLKEKNLLKIFLTHPKFEIKKIVIDVKNYISKNTLLIITGYNDQINLYLNNESLKISKTKNIKDKPEVGDYVLTKLNPFKNNNKINLKYSLPARIRKIRGKNIFLEILNFKKKVKINKDDLISADQILYFI
ncbi:MAG: hypothetical protein GF335_03250 [Candidatus Moranbacteria bacterium]|nr:hypothetical protein [Candidatus Moranbacteria bacterium]